MENEKRCQGRPLWASCPERGLPGHLWCRTCQEKQHTAEKDARPVMQWAGQSIRVEHLVAPGGWLTQPGRHLASCTCRCSDVQTCPECGKPSFPAAIGGRWDAEAGHTARPFEAVWVRLGCGCVFGDESLARPETSVTPPGVGE